MTANGWLQIVLLCGAVLLLTKPLGLYMFKVFSGERTWLSPVLRPVERGLYSVSGVDEEKEQGWLAYAISLLLFSIIGIMVTYVLERTQGGLPFNPANLPAVTPGLAFNTAVSFSTNTNWQAY